MLIKICCWRWTIRWDQPGSGFNVPVAPDDEELADLATELTRHGVSQLKFGWFVWVTDHSL